MQIHRFRAGVCGVFQGPWIHRYISQQVIIVALAQHCMVMVAMSFTNTKHLDILKVNL
tara:strand:- start:10488 stop:10661 length:174 start_codon:yes stop_codon:yes gene_type:complete